MKAVENLQFIRFYSGGGKGWRRMVNMFTSYTKGVSLHLVLNQMVITNGADNLHGSCGGQIFFICLTMISLKYTDFVMT